MLPTNKERINQLYDCVKNFHNLEVLPEDLPNPQTDGLLPLLRPYQVKTVKWMLWKELYPSYYQSDHGNSSSDEQVLLPKGGVLADEMGLGKTVEVLACMLAHPREKLEKNTCVNEKNSPESEKIKFEAVYTKREIDELCHSEDGIVQAEVKNNNESCDIDIGSETVEIKNGCGVDGSSLNELQVTDMEVNSSKVCIVGPPPKTKKPRKKVQKVKIVEQPKEKKTKATKRKNTNSSQTNAKKRKTTQKSSGDSVDIKPPVGRPKRASAVKAGENFALLKAWYNDCLSEMSAHTERSRRFQRQSNFQCCCINELSSENVVECPKCKTWQHAECVGYDKDSADYEYYCFRCWVDIPPLVSSGTVIISPEAISQQWVSEIKKHVKKDNLRVLVYDGVRVNGYIQPHDIAKFDVIITTYQVLNKELNYTEPVSRSLRHNKRYFAPTSPLLFVQWWRLCLDEAQMVEGSTCRAAEMAKKFSSINKWAVTGTPIQKAVNDVVGLMEFLAGDDYPEFIEMIKETRLMLLMVPRVLWRTQMKDVLSETGVPPQTVNTHFLNFSKIEKYFYQCTHTECSQDFLDKIMKFKSWNVQLKNLDRKVMNNLLSPLLKLRQACLHPQAVRGKFLSVKKTMTMADLLSQMVANSKLDAEQSLRQLVAGLNGAAGLHIIRKEWCQAVESYREVLQLEQEHKGRLKIDSLQRIHTMHNLASVLESGHEGIPPTMRDSKLREEVKAMELRYLGRREIVMATTERRVKQLGKKISKDLAGKSLNSCEWWQNVLKWSDDRDELLHRLRNAVQHTDDKQRNQYNALASKLKSLFIVQMEIGVWLNSVDEIRGQVGEWVDILKKADIETMAVEALRCHLPQAGTVKRLAKCMLCKAEDVLKKYEALLFEELTKIKRKKRILPGGSEWGQQDMDSKEVAELVGVNVNTFKSSKKGGFKASPIEKILRALAAYARQKQARKEWTNEANYQINLIEIIKKEFLDVNLMWRQIFDLVDAKDELNMCKTRLRLPTVEEEVAEMEGRKGKKLSDNHFIIPLYKVETELAKLISEKEVILAELKKKIGTHCYLENLHKDGSATQICPICRTDLTDKWSVLQCGHCVCLECLGVLVKPTTTSLVCPQCRQRSNVSAVSCVESEATPQPASTRPVQGNYSTKVDAVISEAMYLTQQQPNVKILVFSAWDKVLNLLAEAFEKNNITFRRLKSGKLHNRQTIMEFKTTDVTVLLLPLRSGAKGLNLVEATHVFLVEPILNPAEELQAVGRVHRIGQDKKTVVHRFIVRETIEERILTTIAESGAEQWSEDCVTLQQMYDLFSGQAEMPLEVSLLMHPSTVSNETQVVSSYSEDSDSEVDDSVNHRRRPTQPMVAFDNVNQANSLIHIRSSQETPSGSSDFNHANCSIQGRSAQDTFNESSDSDEESSLIDGGSAEDACSERSDSDQESSLIQERSTQETIRENSNVTTGNDFLDSKQPLVMFPPFT